MSGPGLIPAAVAVRYGAGKHDASTLVRRYAGRTVKQGPTRARRDCRCVSFHAAAHIFIVGEA